MAPQTLDDYDRENVLGYTVYVKEDARGRGPGRRPGLPGAAAGEPEAPVVPGQTGTLGCAPQGEDLGDRQPVRTYSCVLLLCRPARPTRGDGRQRRVLQHRVLVRKDRLSDYLIHELSHGFHDLYIQDGLFRNEVINDAYDRQLRLDRTACSQVEWPVRRGPRELEPVGVLRSPVNEVLGHRRGVPVRQRGAA